MLQALQGPRASAAASAQRKRPRANKIALAATGHGFGLQGEPGLGRARAPLPVRWMTLDDLAPLLHFSEPQKVVWELNAGKRAQISGQTLRHGAQLMLNK